jgi:hypothetical protein
LLLLPLLLLLLLVPAAILLVSPAGRSGMPAPTGWPELLLLLPLLLRLPSAFDLIFTCRMPAISIALTAAAAAPCCIHSACTVLQGVQGRLPSPAGPTE